MVKSLENGTSLPPFLVKCYEMVNDESTDELISWNQSNQSFVIWDESKFSSQLLPKYFKHSNFSSFVRQLNIYGFRKIDADRWEFANEAFVKGQKHLLKNIIRRKQPQNIVQKNSSQQLDPVPIAPEEEKRVELWKEVENLKADKHALTLELKKLCLHQQTSQSKLLLLREQLKGMEKNQQQMLSFIVMAMQSPEFMGQFLQLKENSWRIVETGKNILSEVTDDCETAPSDGMIVRYQPPKDGDLVPACSAPVSNSEDLMEWDLSSDEMTDILMNIDFFSEASEEKLLPLENEGQLIVPHMPEYDTMLEQLLFSSPAAEDEQFSLPEHDAEASTNSGMLGGSTFQLKESNESNSPDSKNDE